MEHVAKYKEKSFKYVLPILSAAIPVGAMLIKNHMKHNQSEESKEEERLIRKSNLDMQSAIYAGQGFVHGIPIEAKLSEQDGSPVWKVEIYQEKQKSVREVIIDAKSGERLEAPDTQKYSD